MKRRNKREDIREKVVDDFSNDLIFGNVAPFGIERED